MKKRRFEKSGGRRGRLVRLLATVSAASLLLAFYTGGADEDGDGMPDAFERFFGLSVGVDDSADDPDGDGLDNLAESAAGTDPFSADTDLDGWDDREDADPVSRAVYLWGDPRFTYGVTNHYTRPAWASFGLADGGEPFTGGAYAYGWLLDEPGDRLLMSIDRSLVSNDLWLAVAASGFESSPFMASVLDSNLVALTEPVALGDAFPPWQTNRLPLSAWPGASVIALHSAEGGAAVAVSVLYEDSDGDGLDDAQNAQLNAGDGEPPDGLPPAVGGETDVSDSSSVAGEWIGFESDEGYAVGPLDGQMGWEATEGADVSDADAFEGAQSMILRRNDPGGMESRGAVRALETVFTNDVVWCSLRQRCVPNGPRLPRDEIGAAAFVTDETGHVVAYDGISGEWVVSERAFPGLTGVWARVDFRLDYAGKTYTLCFQGIAVHRDIGFADAALARPNGFYMRNDSSHEGSDAMADAIAFSTEEPAGLDFDGDGLSNADERAAGTDEWNADTDGDGLDDLLEIALGLDPLQNNEDYDGDGISNEDELIFGTNPVDPDSDGDGIPDLWLASFVDGASASRLSGDWLASGSCITGLGSSKMRAEYALAVPEAGMYRIALEVSNAAGASSSFRLQILIDGQPFRWLEPELDGTPCVLVLDSPWLVTGTHTVRIAWPEGTGGILTIHSLALYGVDGPDADGDGIQDWMSARLRDEFSDSDGDGISDAEELILGTDPLNPDTDGDTLADGEEIVIFGTDPLSEDSDNDGIGDTSVIQSRLGADTSFRRAFHLTAAWSASEDGELSSQTGNAECFYDMDVPEDGGVRFGVRLRNGPTDPPDDYVFQVAVTVDGVSAGTVSVRADCDLAGTGWVSLPWLKAGTRRFGLRWKNDSDQPLRPTSIVIERVELRAVDAPDTDGDGIQDWSESELRKKGDSDGDGLSDFLEVFQYRTDPFRKDSDGDGLSDGEEIKTYKTDPLNADSDGDGVSDGEEVAILGTDPLYAEFPSAFSETAASAPGSAALATAGIWHVAGTELHGIRRGYAEYRLTAPSAGIYAVSVDAALSWHPFLDRGVSPVTTGELLLYVDGIYLGRVTVRSADGSPDTVRLFTPCVSPGAHTVRVFYNNLNSEQHLHVRRVSLLSAPGEDTDSDGIADWANVLVAGRSGLDPVSWSYASPACLEGGAKFASLATCAVQTADGVSSVPVKPGIAGRWYADVPLAPHAPVAVDIAFENGAASASASVEWRALNLASETGSVTIRAGDSLRITCAPENTAEASVRVSVPGIGTFQTLSTDAAAVLFSDPGSYQVAAAYQGSPEITGTLTVTVLGGAFPETSPVCMVSTPRLWAVPGIGDGTPVETGAGLKATLSGTGQMTLTLSEPYGDHRMVLRAGAGGAVLDSMPATGFWMQGAPEAYARIVGHREGYDVRQSDLVAWGPPPGVEIVISTIVTGVMFDDFSLSRTVAASDFDGAGQYFYRLIHPDSVSAAACHTVKAYQNGEFVGEAWYAGSAVPGVLK